MVILNMVLVVLKLSAPALTIHGRVLLGQVHWLLFPVLSAALRKRAASDAELGGDGGVLRDPVS